MKTLDNMITDSIEKLELDTRSGKEKKNMYNEIKELSGQIKYKDNIFIIDKQKGSSGMGGMDMGEPDKIIVYKIK